MSDWQPHLLVTVAFGPADSPIFTVAKALGSSLMRSLFSGDQMILHNRPMPLFKSERRQVEELILSLSLSRDSAEEKERERRGHFFRAMKRIAPKPGQWVIVASVSGIALRNIDHLIPSDANGSYPPRAVDFYWAEAGGDTPVGTASPGFWAVRSEHLTMVLDLWERALDAAGLSRRGDDAEIWSKVVAELPLMKKRFEPGEVVSPRLSSVDWPAVSGAAFVALCGWPEEEELKFLQALYFGTYLGDGHGTMLNILEA